MPSIPFTNNPISPDHVKPLLDELRKEIAKKPDQIDYNAVLISAVHLYAAASGVELRPVAQPHEELEAATRALLRGQATQPELGVVKLDPTATEARCTAITTARTVVGALFGLGEPLREKLGEEATSLRSDVKSRFELVRPLTLAFPRVATALKATDDFLYDSARRGAQTRRAVAKGRAEERARTPQATDDTSLLSAPQAAPALPRRRSRTR